MTKRVGKIRFVGTFASRHEAVETLQMTGDAALVHRGVPRMVIMKCPCGCGDLLLVNLDRRAGPAWRIYRRGKSISLFPSYWRDTHCESHFILWRNDVFWCDWYDETLWKEPSNIEGRVLSILSEEFIAYERIAEMLEEIPWDVLQACHALARKGKAIENGPTHKGEFRLIPQRQII